jgi:hypothetical protein
LEPIAGLPKWLDGITDTGCIAARGSTLAVADKGGHLYVSLDGGSSWQLRDDRLPAISSVLILD